MRLKSLSQRVPTLREIQAEKARRGLIGFAKYTNPAYVEAGHHLLIAEKLEQVERGEIDRLMVFMPPRHGKSELASRKFPAHYLGKHPTRQIIAASYNSDLATDFGRDVRNLVASPEYGEVFPGVSLRVDSKAADRMNTNHGGVYIAAGVGTATTGRGAHLGIIDDPFKDRQDADSERQREAVWNWYRSTFFTRLMPGGAIVLIQCMVGSTQVLMADGTEKQLREIAPGDEIASYKDGRIVSAKVLNWANQGDDRVFTIRTSSGITVTANERHPFLVSRGGDLEWVRLRDLKTGDKVLRVIGASGAASRALLRDVSSQQGPKGSVAPTTANGGGPTVKGHLRSTRDPGATPTSSTDTALVSLNTKRCSPSKGASAPSAMSFPERMSALIGAESSALTTATSAEPSEGFYATTVIWRSATENRSEFYSRQLDTYGITADAVVEIVEAGREDVFDIQVEGTENFIANGLVSHNTRWHEDDLAGRLLEQDGRVEDGGEWTVLELPAIWDGKALWPEWYPRESLERIKRTIGPREWSALYMQAPQPDEGGYFKRDWLTSWVEKPAHLRIYGTSDYAVTDGAGDYTVHRIWGVDPSGGLYRLDGWRGQTAADEWIERKIDLIAKWKPMAWFGEAGVIQKAVEPMLRRRMIERKVFCRLEWAPSISDKPARARGFQARASMGLVWLEPGADISEFLHFPAGKHDDEVDAAGIIGRMLDEAHPAIIPRQETRQTPPDLWGRRKEAVGWKVA